jgi:hypothetical protein
MPTRRPGAGDLPPSPTTAAPPSPTTPPERQRQAAPPRKPTTSNDSGAPAESVRVSDVPAHGRGRAYLVERELERDGHDALLSLVGDYIRQAELHDAVPMTAPDERWQAHVDEDVSDA